MIEVKGTWHVLAVNDLEKSTQYYIDILGFKLEFSVEGWRFLSRGVFRVMLGECPDEVPASEINNHSYIAYINVEGIDALYAEFKNNGAKFTQEVADKPWDMREFGIVTPDGHRMMFGEEIES